MSYYVPVKAEWHQYHSFKPSALQKIIHFFFPMMFMVKWHFYKDIDIEECIN